MHHRAKPIDHAFEGYLLKHATGIVGHFDQLPVEFLPITELLGKDIPGRLPRFRKRMVQIRKILAFLVGDKLLAVTEVEEVFRHWHIFASVVARAPGG